MVTSPPSPRCRRTAEASLVGRHLERPVENRDEGIPYRATGAGVKSNQRRLLPNGECPPYVGQVVLQLDGRPAEAVYLEKLGMADVHLSDEDFEAIAMAHPLAQPELSGDVRPRYVRGRAPGGGLICATSIEANAPVVVCEQKPEETVRSAAAAVDQALHHLDGSAEAVLLFDCAARSEAFGNPLASREIDSIMCSFGHPAPALAGVYTRGEIGRIRGAKGDRNFSVVVVALGSAH